MPDPIHTLVAGVADPDGTDPVLGYALELARRAGGVLHVVHAYDPPDTMLNMGLAAADVMAGMPPVPVWNLQEAKELEDALRARLRAHLPDVAGRARVELHVEAGPAHSVLARTAERVGADLVVLGASRRHGLERAVLGGTAERALREVPAPTLVLRAPLATAGSRVLLTTDLSGTSAVTCAAGLQMARTLFQGERFAVRCLYVEPMIVGDAAPPRREELAAGARAELERFLAALPAGGDPPEPVVRVGMPAAEIVAEAEGWPADLVVLGTHGRTGISRLLLGSVAESVVRETGRDALVVHAAALREG